MITDIHRPRARANKTRPVINLNLRLKADETISLSPVERVRTSK